MTSQRAFVIAVGILSTTVCYCYKIPKPTIKRLHPKGLRVSIPDEKGITLFAFHGNVNRAIDGFENGDIMGEVTSPRGNRWIYENSSIHLGNSDVLHYGIVVEVNGTAHFLSESSNEDERPTKSPSKSRLNCKTSVTSIRGKLTPCRDRLIFEELFDYDLFSKMRKNNVLWRPEILAPLDPDYEFTLYGELETNSLRIKDGNLRIGPYLLDNEFFPNYTLRGALNLRDKCTSTVPAECTRHAVGFSILPPVVSSRISTKHSFHFRYGIIEIRAKFPKGDWLYPELWLEPKNKSYGSGYSNGRVILGMARGNENLFQISEPSLSYETVLSTLGSNLLEFGLRTGPSNNIREDKVTMRKTLGTWTDDFHIYTTIWDKSGFTFKVDGKEVGRLNPPQSGCWLNALQCSGKEYKLAPYNDEFYITLGLGVGGVRVFPDGKTGVVNAGSTKPWRNVEAKAMLHFWQHRDNWLQSWKYLHKDLAVDYVKVWSV